MARHREMRKATAWNKQLRHWGTGKWMARSETAAWRWGKALDHRYPSWVVILELDDIIVERACLIDNLDDIGPAIYVEGDDLPQIQVVGVVEHE